MRLARLLRSVGAALAFIAASGCSEPSGAPSVLLVVVDTLRADFLSAWGHPHDTSPHLSRLAESGVSFRSCVAASPWTGPSVASIVTGRYPDELGIRGLFHPLPPEAETLAERLAAAGFATGAVVSNAIVGPAYGHDAGYDEFYFARYKEGELDLGGNEAARPSFTADRVTDRALEWLERADAPFFLHVHYTDPHEPYLAPEEWRQRFTGPPPLAEELLLAKRFTKLRLTPEQLEALRRSYEAEIAFADAEIGRLLAALPADAIVVFVADHGEEFLEHGDFLHGHTLFEELLRVPLILRGPGIPEGVVVETPVSHVDVTPTILDLLGLPADGLTGRSLRPLFDGESRPGKPRAILSMREKQPLRCASARLERWKLVRCGKRKPALYDLLEDPLERRNVASQHEKVVAHLVARLDRHEQELRPVEAVHDPEGEEQRLRELRAIGYVE